MAVQFREKALMAKETMPLKHKDKVAKVIRQLDINKIQFLHSHQLRSQTPDIAGLNRW